MLFRKPELGDVILTTDNWDEVVNNGAEPIYPNSDKRAYFLPE